MRISACLRCGSRNLRMLTLGDGLIPEATERLKWVCADCSWQGTPLEFDDEAAWSAFRQAVKEDATAL